VLDPVLVCDCPNGVLPLPDSAERASHSHTHTHTHTHHHLGAGWLIQADLGNRGWCWWVVGRKRRLHAFGHPRSRAATCDKAWPSAAGLS